MMLSCGSDLLAWLGFPDLSVKFILHSFKNVDAFAAFNIRIYLKR